MFTMPDTFTQERRDLLDAISRDLAVMKSQAESTDLRSLVLALEDAIREARALLTAAGGAHEPAIERSLV
jgi:hypothetical protein